MLTPDGQPLRSSLPDRRGLEMALAEFNGRRIVVAFNPERTYYGALSAHRDGLDERDMVVLIILPPDHPLLSAPASPPVFVLTDGGGHIASACGAPADKPFFCLIGKDGTIKEAGPDLPTPAELFGRVDAMPMRRQEMRDRDRQRRG